MKNISIRSTTVLSIIGAISIGLMILVEFTKKEQIQPFFQEKIAAASLMESCIEYLKYTHFKDDIAIDNINDPNDTRIIGTRYSAITSGRGSLPIKLSTVNPNFAALIVKLFHDANLKKGDHIAIGATGSFPALNIAVLAAAEIMGLEVSFISSVTSSSWGANDPDYTYLDIHTSLNKGNLVTNKIIASSIGANQDIGRTISIEGRYLAREAIERNGAFFINGESLNENIEKRIEILGQREIVTGKEIKLYVNIGGGIANLGSVANSEGLPPGLLKDVKLNIFNDKIGVMFEMASKKTFLINLQNLKPLMTKYGLPEDPVPLPQVGKGRLFYDLKYDMRYVSGATIFLILLLLSVIIFDKRQHALGSEIIKKQKQIGHENNFNH